MGTITIKTLERVDEYFRDPEAVSCDLPQSWAPDCSVIKDDALKVQALKQLVQLKAHFDLPQAYRVHVENRIQELNLLRKKHKETLERHLRDIKRVEKIIVGIEHHRQNYLSHVHMVGDAEMTMDLEQRERHRLRLEEWEDEILFRQAMLKQLRAKAREALPVLNQKEAELEEMVSSHDRYREVCREELKAFPFGESVKFMLIEKALNEDQVTFLSMEQWSVLTEQFNMPMLRQLQHHFKPQGSLGFVMREDWRYYSSLSDAWLLGGMENEGISFNNPALQYGIKNILSKVEQKRVYCRSELLRTFLEDGLEGRELSCQWMKVWLGIALNLGETQHSALIKMSSVLKTYQLQKRSEQICLLVEIAQADGAFKKEEADLLRSIEHQLKMPNVSLPILEKAIERSLDLVLLPTKEDLLEQACRMAMCDDHLHDNEKACLQNALKTFEMSISDLQTHLEKRVG